MFIESQVMNAISRRSTTAVKSAKPYRRLLAAGY
jgi:hypothetical protein